MKVAVDALPLLGPFTGIAHYTRELMQRMQALAGIELFYCYGLYWDRSLRVHPVAHYDAVRKSARSVFPAAARSIYRGMRQAVFSAGARRRRIDLYHAPNYLPLEFDGPTVITVHDLSYLRYPETHPADRVEVMTRQLPRAIERASFVLVDSHFVRQEVLSAFPKAADKVITTHLGVSERFRPMAPAETATVVGGHGLVPGSYVLSVGTLEPRKNLVGTLEAFSQLPAQTRARFPLALVGMTGWRMEGMQERITSMAHTGEIRLLGYVSPADLPAVYAGAAAFVYPSLYEGFGLPVLEALASGIPVVASNTSSLPEVAGEVALTLDPHDHAGLANALKELLEPSSKRQARIQKGIDWARSFTWERCAQQTFAVYQRALLQAGAR
jgi:glycosyltransferase involved in cell wall biosynthesis